MRSFRRLVLLCCVAALALHAPARAEDVQADSAAMDWSRVPEYRLVPGDELILNFGPQSDVPSAPDLARRQKIRPDGRVSVFPIGDVVAAGHTVRELEAALVNLLGAELRRPRVTVEVASVAGNMVHVLGRVENSGSYPAEPYMTVTQAVARAGGFKEDAATNSVLVFHRDGARTLRVARVRLGDALKRGRLDADLPLGRFDIVYVPRSSIGNISAFTRQMFAENASALNFALVGWELFNLNKVFVVPTSVGK
ncbi:MAG: polysaccharide biosynthesis/export family protein [Candidatus Eisenbacteria bacterium]|uniref:Polysaccharide biosynthesis/export family protein n=1 Tax=Eiseniibacteriota bacterium TaxID=2212470 RepID=A0A9D6L632_UNCEI|nr:polysaccharide biosynthesis/export family protein [Candidatus Eisenbacteria bacterium]